MNEAEYFARQLEIAWANGDYPSFALVAKAINAGVDINELETKFHLALETLLNIPEDDDNEYED